MTYANLKGRLVLVVEDEPLVALDVAQSLEDHGASVMLASSVAAALLALESATPAAAVLDWRVSDGTVEPICETLERSGIPWTFHSGANGAPSLRWKDSPRVSKPAGSEDIVRTLDILLAGSKPRRG